MAYTDEEKAFSQKLAAAMVGHAMADITTVLADALGLLLQEADPAVRNQITEDVCARIAVRAARPR